MIFINTLGRVKTQPTLEAMLKAGLKPVLLVQYHEKDLYNGYDVVVIALPERIKTLPETRQWLIDNSPYQKIIIIDDDFTFYKRKEGTSLEKANSEDINDMIETIYSDLENYAAVGISMRQGNNHVKEDYKENGAINGLLGLRVDILHKENIRFDHNPAMEDKHITLDLLTKGYKNKVWFKWCYNQPASNTAGGCSTYRTAELQKQAAEMLAASYPGLVTVKVKTTKGGWFGGQRYDVICYWKKAYLTFKGTRDGL